MKSLTACFAFCLLLGATANAAEPAPKIAPEVYVRYSYKGEVSYGIREGDKVRKIDGDLFGQHTPTSTLHDFRNIEILIPTQPSKVIALAGNYKDHLGDKPVFKTPEPFFKLPSSLLEAGGAVVQPKGAAPIHYEAELVIVIGKRAKKVSEAAAMDYVFGVTCGNDISARDWQKGDVQWWRAKGSDTFGPVGPNIVRNIDYGKLDMTLRVNGEVKQKTNTKNMVHNIPQTVSFISQHVTLEPGDLIFTGTPGKTEAMNVGDVVEVEIEHVGTLHNTIVAEK